MRCADDTEKFMHHDMKTVPAESYPTRPPTSSQHTGEEEHHSRSRLPPWHDPRQKHAIENFSRYSYSASHRHLPPPPYGMCYHPDFVASIDRGGSAYPPEFRRDSGPEGKGAAEIPSDVRKKKRRASMSAFDLERDARDSDAGHPGGERSDSDLAKGRPHGARVPHKPGKRTRVNWSEEENLRFFDVIKKFATSDESTVLREAVHVLSSRNWVQCKGHFRNMQSIGRISQTDTEPKVWVINEDFKNRSRAGRGKATSSRSGANEDADKQDDENNKNSLDEEADVTASLNRAIGSQATNGANGAIRANGMQSAQQKPQHNFGMDDEEGDDDEDADDENDEDYQNPDGTDIDGMVEDEGKIAGKGPILLGDDVVGSVEGPRLERDGRIAEKSPSDERALRTSFDATKMTIPFKKQTSSTRADNQTILPQLRPRDMKVGRRYEYRSSPTGEMGRYPTRK